MFLRLMFVLLIALNIAVGAWLLLGQPYARGGMATDPGVPQLRLLSELPEPLPAPVMPPLASSAAIARTATIATATAVRPPPLSCVALGPFATPQDLRRAREALSGQATRTRSRQEQATQSHGWWVYLPAMASRAKALSVARELGDRHIGDYFVVSSGDQPNTISLGLFKDQANARKRRAEVLAAGFPAQLTERSETVPEYWLDAVFAGQRGADWHRRVPGIAAHSTACF